MASTRRNICMVLALVFFVVLACNGTDLNTESKEFSFVLISDVHVPSYSYPIGLALDEQSLMPMHNQQRIQEFTEECLALSPKPAFVMNVGDTGDAGWMPLLKLYQKLMQPLVSAEIPVYTVVGNHDLDYAGITRDDLAEVYDPLGPALIGCGGTRYSFDYGGCHFIVMNNRPISGLIRFNPEDIEWLRRDLSKIRKNTRLFLFMHANMPEDDTQRVVELLQPFARPVIFHGHSHSDAVTAWGGVPVVVTGSLYGGKPEAGSYRVVTVTPEQITVRTRDFATPAGTFGPEKTIEPLVPAPSLHILSPEDNADFRGKLTVKAEANPAAPGTLEYSIPGISKWTVIPGENGQWETEISTPSLPGRYFLAVRFTGENGAVTLSHREFTVAGETVHEAWSRDLGSAIQGVPAIWNDLVIVPTMEGTVHALRLRDGGEAWKMKAGGQVSGRVSVEGDQVFFGAGRSVYALDAATGKQRWSTPVDGSIVIGPAVSNGAVFAPAGEQHLYCLDAASGKIRWDHTVPRPIIMEPAPAGERVYFAAMDGHVRALDAATGREIWDTAVSSPDDNYPTAAYWTPAVVGDTVLASKRPASQDEHTLHALSAEDGKTLWSRPLAAWPTHLVLSPEKDRLYAALSSGGTRGVQCLSTANGDSLAVFDTGVVMNGGVVRGGNVFARDNNSMCCVDAATGAVRWTYRLSTGPQGSLYGPTAFAVTENLAVAGTMDGRVIALKW